MNLGHNQTVELDSSFFDGCDVELVPISGIEEYTEDCPMDITVDSGYFQDASGLQCKNCGSHSLEYLKKFGLRNISNLRTDSNPANSASVLTGHLNTFIASMQANYAGALGFGYINTFYAPLLVGMDDKQLHQTAQEMIFNGSQNAFSRGGQTVFSDYNIDTGVPVYLKDTPAIHAGGKYMATSDIGAKVTLSERTVDGEWQLFYDPVSSTPSEVVLLRERNGKREYCEPEGWHVLRYGDYEEEAQKFAHALLDVWGEGDARGRVFEFPKCDFHVRAETFTDPKQYEVFMHACRLAAKNGSTYFVFDRDSVSLSSCCRLRTKITDMSMLNHPESLRTLGFQNVTINIPQAAFRASRAGEKSLEGLFKQIDAAMDLAMDAHRQKRAFIATLMDGPGKPLWQMGKPACDGKPYVDLNSAMYIIGLIGVNEAVQFLTGKQLHESDEAYKMGLEITGHMYLRCQKYTKETGMQVRLEESPAESAARRLAKADLVFYRDEALSVYKGGDEDHAYYTNSIHIVADADIDALERSWRQAAFNPIIEAGAITHLFIGEQEPDPGSIASLIKWIFLNTQSAQCTISPEFTYCNTCGKKSRGLYDKCQHCGSTDVIGETRIVGYFSPIQSWNLSKLAELRARQRGRYAVEGVQA